MQKYKSQNRDLEHRKKFFDVIFFRFVRFLMFFEEIFNVFYVF